MHLCKYCNTEISDKKTFCNNSCAAKFNNKGVRRHGNPKSHCVECGKITKGPTMKFCSNYCCGVHRSKQLSKSIIENKQMKWRSIRKFLISTVGKCQSCGISKWNEQEITLECDHIDGDKSNNCLENAKLLCPNCHSQTPTYRAKNKNNPKSKQQRSQRYKTGDPGRI